MDNEQLNLLLDTIDNEHMLLCDIDGKMFSARDYLHYSKEYLGEKVAKNLVPASYE